MPGAAEGQAPGQPTTKTIRARVEKAAGRPDRYFAADGELIIPANDEAYLAWLTLTGRELGQPSGRTSLLQILKGKPPYEAEVQSLIDAALKPGADHGALTKGLNDLYAKIGNDKSFLQIASQPSAPSEPAKSVALIKNGDAEVNGLTLPRAGPGGPVQPAAAPPVMEPESLLAPKEPIAEPAPAVPRNLPRTGMHLMRRRIRTSSRAFVNSVVMRNWMRTQA